MMISMVSLDISKLWGRLAGSRAVGQVAEELAGEAAQKDLLRAAGYPGQAQGLLQRLATELNQTLPLRTASADLRAFGRLFPGHDLLTQARQEAQAHLSPPPSGGHAPSSQISLGLEEAAAFLPWTGGGRFLRLIQAYSISGDDDLAQAALVQVEEFCACFPPLVGAGWLGPGLVAQRALNWLWGLRLLAAYPRAELLNRAQPGLTTLAHLRIMGSMLEHEVASRRGAWQPGDVGPAGGLLFLGRCLGFLPESGAWWELGQQALGPALQAWAQPGTTPAGDQAAAATEWGALGVWLAGRAGVEMPGAKSGLRHLAGLCRAVGLPWGGMALWGWDLAAPVLGLGQGPETAWGQAANLAALVLNAPELRGPGLMDPRLYWLFGADGADKLRAMAGEPPPGAGDWPGAGLTALAGKAGQTRVGVYLRTGPRQASGPAQAAQALALALVKEGQPVLVCPGPAGEGPLGPHLAGRSAMNAVMLDEQEPQAGQVVLESLEGGPRHLFASATYDGYGHLPDPALLRRRVHLDLEAGLVNVVDQVQAQGRHLMEIFFHLPPGAQVKTLEQGAYLLEGGFGLALFKPEPKARVSLVQGRSNPPLGWLALEPGQIKAAPVLRVQAAVQGNARLTSTFALNVEGEEK